jgi:hypothetical protein
MNLVYFLGIIIILSFLYPKVLEFFGLTNRDGGLIIIGLLIPGFISGAFSVITGAYTAGGINMLIHGAFIYYNYRRL